MDFQDGSTDAAVLSELGERLARYRLNQNVTQDSLAGEAGISLRTLQRLEDGRPAQLASLVRVLRALGLLQNLDALVPAPASSPLQQVARRGQERRRASRRSGRDEQREPWTWGDDE